MLLAAKFSQRNKKCLEKKLWRRVQKLTCSGSQTAEARLYFTFFIEKTGILYLIFCASQILASNAGAGV